MVSGAHIRKSGGGGPKYEAAIWQPNLVVTTETVLLIGRRQVF
jgi:hypothetical protein